MTSMEHNIKSGSSRQGSKNSSRNRLQIGRTLIKLVFLSEHGRSLPAALIALAVGSMLMAPFLSFVSSRARGTRAADQNLKSLYTADAGIEYGVWSLIHDSDFRADVDSQTGFFIDRVFPYGPVNDYDPEVKVKALPIGIWSDLAYFPTDIGSGGALAYDGGDRIYALRGGGTKTFKYYSISSNQWFNLDPTPRNVGAGSALVYEDGYVYAIQGNNKKGFWRYSNSAGWEELDDTKKNASSGGALASDGSNIYAMGFGNNQREFYRYNISSQKWDNKKLKNTPNAVTNGAALVHAGGNDFYALQGSGSNNFWRYDKSNDKWNHQNTTPQPIPQAVGAGGSLAYGGGDYIYALQGGGAGFYRYSISGDGWTQLAAAPDAVGSGGSLVFTDAKHGFALQGGNQADFWKFEVTPPRYDISSSIPGFTNITARVELDGNNNPILFWDID